MPPKNRPALLALALALACLWGLSGTQLSAQDDFESLFNGRDFTGWQVPQDSRWRVQDGLIFLDRDGDGQEHNHVYLWTAEAYENFILELEFKIPARANSGIFLRTTDLQDPVDTGLEVQVANSHGRAELSRTSTAGAIYDLVAPSQNPLHPPGQWNQMRIECRGPRIQVRLNGTSIIDMDTDNWTEAGRNPDGSANKFSRPITDFGRRGHIGLQDHGLPTWYRNIRIQRLPEEPEMPVAYRFPNDPQVPVLTLDLSGGLRVPTPADFRRRPLVSVFADGRIVCGAQVPDRPNHVGQLTAQELGELLDFVVQQQGLLQITPDQLAEELQGYRSNLADGPTSTIKLQLQDQTHELSVYALGLAAWELPDEPGLQALLAIEQRLRQVKQWGDLGSRAVLDSALRAANEALTRELPDANPWSEDQLRRIERPADGGVKLSFSRAKSISDDGYTLNMQVQRASEGQPWQVELQVQ